MATVESLAKAVKFFPETVHRQADRLATVSAELSKARLAFSAAKAAHEKAAREGEAHDAVQAWKKFSDTRDTVAALESQRTVLAETLEKDLTEALRGTSPAPVRAATSRDRKDSAAKSVEAATHLRRAFEALADCVDVFTADRKEPTGASLLHEETARLTASLPADVARALRQRVVPSCIPGGIPPVVNELFQRAQNVLSVYDEAFVDEWRKRQAERQAARAI